MHRGLITDCCAEEPSRAGEAQLSAPALHGFSYCKQSSSSRSLTHCLHRSIWAIQFATNVYRPDEVEINFIVAQVGLLATLITFLLGFFIADTLGRWWALRTALAQLHGSLRNLSLTIRNTLNPNADPTATEQLKQHVSRMIQLSHRLIFIEARVYCPREGRARTVESFLLELQSSNLLTDQELSLLKEHCETECSLLSPGGVTKSCFVTATQQTLAMYRISKLPLMWLQQRVIAAERGNMVGSLPAQPIHHIFAQISSAALSIDSIRYHAS